MREQRIQEIKALCDSAIASGQDLAKPIDFYSTASPGLVLNCSSGRVLTNEHGKERRVDQIHAEFNPQSAVKQADGTMKAYGLHSTRNPHAVLAILKRIEEKNDICDSETYLQLITPHEETIRFERERTITTQNELLQALEENKRLKKENASLAAEKGKGKKEDAAA